MDIARLMRIMDASARTRRTMERSLHEIDRRALNAMVLVKRHGNKLASYGVVAQAFREQAVRLKEATAPLQLLIAPLVRANLRIVQHRRFASVFRQAADKMGESSRGTSFLVQAERNCRGDMAAEEADGLLILRRLTETVARLQEGIAEQEYVVTNGRIEAALSEETGAPLMRVSDQMGLAVTKVREAIWGYRAELEEVLHEGSVSL